MKTLEESCLKKFWITRTTLEGNTDVRSKGKELLNQNEVKGR